jgi:NitT/TauT family transport system permease protein
VPLFILWFGFGPTSKIAVATMLAFFPIMTNTSFGIKSIPQDMRDLFHVTRFRSFSRFWRLELPYATPYVLAGAEVGIVLATIGAIVGEYLSGDRGLGRYAVALQNSLLIPELYASIIMMTALGFLFYVSVMAIRRLLIPWHESVKGSTNQVS